MVNPRSILMKLTMLALMAAILTGCASSRMMPPNYTLMPTEPMSEAELETLTSEVQVHSEPSYEHVEDWYGPLPAGVKVKSTTNEEDEVTYESFEVAEAFRDAYQVKGEVLLDFESARDYKWWKDAAGLWRFESASQRATCGMIFASKLLVIGWFLNGFCKATPPDEAYVRRRLKAAASKLGGNSVVMTHLKTTLVYEVDNRGRVLPGRPARTRFDKVRALVLHDPFFETTRTEASTPKKGETHD